jgi:O-acetylserine/cysteine efflux transporter
MKFNISFNFIPAKTQSEKMLKKQNITGNSSARTPLFVALAGSLVAACWGGNFSASQITMQHFPPFMTVFLRFALLCLMLAPFALRMPRPRMRDMALLSLFYITLHFSLIFLAMARGLNITSTVIATQMGVPFSCLMAAILFRDRLGLWRSSGLFVSFSGLLLIAGSPNALHYWQAFLIAIGGALAWSIANILIKKMPPCGIIPMLFWPALFCLPQIIILSAIFESNQLHLLATITTSAALGISYSAIFSSLIGYGLWMWLLQNYQMSQVVPYSLFTPLVGIACGVLLFHDPLTLMVIIGAAMTMLGVAIITIRRPKLAELEQV